MIIKQLLMSSLFLCVLSCCITRTQKPVQNEIEPVVNPSCHDVCKRGEQLDCSWALPTLEGATCIEVCQNVQSSGIVNWDLDCRVTAKTCNEVDECERLNN